MIKNCSQGEDLLSMTRTRIQSCRGKTRSFMEGDGGDCAARTLDQDPGQYTERESGEGGPEKQRPLGLGLRFYRVFGLGLRVQGLGF